MVRKSALVFGILCSAWFVLDVAATNAEACGGCRRRSCGSNCCAAPCYAPPVCSPCGSGCGSCGSNCGLFRSRCSPCGSSCNTCYAAPVFVAPACSTCATGYAVPGAYGYAVRVAPTYGPSYVLSRAGVPSMTYASSAGYPSYAAPVTAYRTNTVLRTSYAAPSFR